MSVIEGMCQLLNYERKHYQESCDVGSDVTERQE